MRQFRGTFRLFARGDAAAVCAVCLLAVLASASARADLKITMHASMNSPMMQNLPPQMANMLGSTTYISGKKFLLKTFVMSVLVDRGNKKIVIMYPMSKTYTVTPFNPTVAASMAQGGPNANVTQGGAKTKVVDTGKTISILGHKARHYVVTALAAGGQMSGTSVKTDIYAATDLPAADLAAYSGLAAGSPSKLKISGIPLKTVTSSTGGPMGNFTMTNQATSISTAPIPSSVFSIPSGYTKAQGPPAMPGGGMPGMGAPSLPG